MLRGKDLWEEGVVPLGPMLLKEPNGPFFKFGGLMLLNDCD